MQLQLFHAFVKEIPDNFCWAHGHLVVEENERADSSAKSAIIHKSNPTCRMTGIIKFTIKKTDKETGHHQSIFIYGNSHLRRMGARNLSLM